MQFQTDENGQIVLADPNGQLQAVDPSEVRDAIEKGQYSVPDPQQIQEADLKAKYGTGSQQVLSGVEGLLKGATAGVFPGFGEKGEAEERAKQNPWTHGIGEVGGLAGSLALAPEISAGKLLGAAGEATTGALGLAGETALGKVGQAAAQGAVEAGLYQTGNELSKVIADNPDSVQTAIANIGLTGLIGGGIGGVLGAANPLWEATSGSKLSQFIGDFKGRIREHVENPEPSKILSEELSGFYNNTKQAADEVYGAEGLKGKAIEKSMPEMGPKITQQAQDVSDELNFQISKMVKDTNRYPPRLIGKLQDDAAILKEGLNKAQNPSDIFNAIQDLKQTAQGYAKFDKFVKPVDEAYDFVKQMKDFSYKLRQNLEDTKVWGKAAEAQQTINKAFKEFLPTLQDFEKKFTTEVSGERIIDPGKLNTYLNQLGKPNAEIKQQMLGNFLDAAQKYRGVIDKAHGEIGSTSPLTGTSLNYALKTTEKVSAGQKFADALVKKGLSRLGGESLGAITGGAAGATVGHPFIGALIGEHALGPFFSSILPSIIKPILGNDTSAKGLKDAIEMGMAVIKGESLLNKASKNIFKAGQDILPSHLIPDEKKLNRLDDKLKDLQENPSSLVDIGGKVGHYMPDHATSLGKTAGNLVNTLNLARPTEEKKAPLDTDQEINPIQKAQYQRMLTIAQQPLIVLQHLKNGTLMPQDVVFLSQSYPALYERMKEKLTTDLTDTVSDGDHVPYKIRMGLSLFLGQPLDSTMTPQAIQAIQMQNMPQTPPPQQVEHRKVPENSLKKLAPSYQTPGQSAEARRVMR